MHLTAVNLCNFFRPTSYIFTFTVQRYSHGTWWISLQTTFRGCHNN